MSSAASSADIKQMQRHSNLQEVSTNLPQSHSQKQLICDLGHSQRKMMMMNDEIYVHVKKKISLLDTLRPFKAPEVVISYSRQQPELEPESLAEPVNALN